MKRLCTICARGNSKGVPNKNLIVILGLPLIAHSIRQAQESGLFEDIAVSSDSPEILETAIKWGANLAIERPKPMASDTAAKLPAIRHCFLEAERRLKKTYAVNVDLDATSPLRTPQDIQGAVSLLQWEHVQNVITGSSSRRSPYFNLVEETEAPFVTLSKTLETPVVRRQDTPRTFDLNASIYVWSREALLNQETVISKHTALYEMPEERSLDIDSPLDLKIVQFLMNERPL